ncbi:hypothetical protein Ahy_B04g069533 isoform B [Arachis hypogaea]|uniref:Phospholipase/carboxylesterase/thioesterase domain-containing protein n=1 Tax=Arachis hypogaea TaxID=3818 RepID=A0A444ZCW9_ARAHY|nr:hypothetical protein Ahy_B04g069533 isoform B [Arachis hypogaea]
MKFMPLNLIKPIVVLLVTLTSAVFFVFQSPQTQNPSSSLSTMSSSSSSSSMGRSFVLWLHGLGDSGPANEPIKNLFTSPQFRNTKWLFPSAPNAPVTCNYGHVMPSWFDIHEIPITADSPQDESGLIKAVKNVHATIYKEIADGTNPNNVFICGFSQGGCFLISFLYMCLYISRCFHHLLHHTNSFKEKHMYKFPMNCSNVLQTPLLWSHGIIDRTVLFEAGQAGPPFLEKIGVGCEFKAYPGLAHSISNEELRNLESWIKTRLQTSS